MAVNKLCLRSPITEPRRKATEAKRTSTLLHGYHHALYGLGRSGSLLRRISREAKKTGKPQRITRSQLQLRYQNSRSGPALCFRSHKETEQVTEFHPC